MSKNFLRSIAIAAALTSLYAGADSVQTMEPGNKDLSKKDFSSVADMESLVAPLPEAKLLFNEYLNQGYQPFHSMMLTNWDVTEGLQKVNPEITENQEIKKRIEFIRNMYIKTEK